MQYRIFIGKPGAHNDSSKLEFVAAFPDRDTAAEFVRELFGTKKAEGKEIVIKNVKTYEVNASEGVLEGLITPIGEEIPLDELQ